MGMPSKKELDRIRKLLENEEPSRGLPENPTQVEVAKYKICEKFVIYLNAHDMSQAELARKLEIDPARMNEIVRYRINLFTLDKLAEFAERLDPNFKLEVA